MATAGWATGELQTEAKQGTFSYYLSHSLSTCTLILLLDLLPSLSLPPPF